MENNSLLTFIMRKSGETGNDTPKTHCTDPTSNNHCIKVSESDLKITFYINGAFYFFRTRRPTDDELHSCEKIFINPNLQYCNPYCTSYGLNERSM